MSVIDSITQARSKGASDDQILAEIAKQNPDKATVFSQAQSTGANASQILDEVLKQNSSQLTPSRGIVGGAVNTLLVKPAARFAEAVGRTGVLGNTIKTGYEEMQGQNQEIKLPGAKEAIGTVEPQKAFGQGGGTQIFSDALKSATYLAPYGKIAGLATTGANAIGAGEIAGRIIGGVASGAVGGYATDVGQNLENQNKVTGRAFIPGFATILGGATGGLLETGGVGIEKLTAGARAYGKELEEQSFKLTPTQRTNLGSKLDELTTFASDKIPAGNPEQRLTYADDLVDHYESNLQYFLDTVSKENRNSTSISKDTFIRQLNSIKGAYKYERDASAVYKQIDDAITTIKAQYPGEKIPVNKLNVFKRSTYQNAYNKAGSKVLDTVEHDIGDAARVAIERATKGGMIGDKSVGEFNHEYGNLLQVKKLLKLASGRPELGFTKRITSRIVGGLIGHALGGIPGIIGGELIAEPIANQIAGTAAKTGLSKKLMKIEPRKVGSIVQKIPTIRNPISDFRNK